MTAYQADQFSLFDQDTAYGRTCRELSAQTAVKTSKPSSRSSSKSQSPTLPMCLCLNGGDGASQDSSTMQWEDGAWPGGLTMRSTTVYRNGEKESVYWLTSTGFQQARFCLTLNMSERPRTANPSRLSDILEMSPNEKYKLSAKACQGILNRAERRGKELPAELKAALIAQSVCKETESTEPTQPDATVLDGVGGGSYTLNTIDRPAVVSFQERAGKPGGAKEYSCRMNEQVPCQPSAINQSAYPINAMVAAVDCRNGVESEINGTLQSKCGQNINSNNVIRTQDDSS